MWEQDAGQGRFAVPRDADLFYSNGMALASHDPMALKPDIELVALTKRYGDTLAVDSIDLRIPAGSYCCLLGPSGCGKTKIGRAHV